MIKIAEIIGAVKSAFGNINYLVLFGIGILLCLILGTRRRKYLVSPIIVLTVIILNPWLKHFWDRSFSYMYWRTFWMIPIIPICAVAPALIIERIKKNSNRIICIIISAGVFVFCGSLVYSNESTSFSRSSNPDKLPSSVPEIASELLLLDDIPSVVADQEISIYIRQYSGSIRTPYTRDFSYGNPSPLAREIMGYLNSCDMQNLSTIMRNHDYEYLVTKAEDKEEKLAQAGFELVKQVGIYGIFRVHSKKTEARTYNELHQVTSVTTVDSNGEAVRSSEGYATVYYKYDSNGRKNFEFYVDENGHGVIDDTGKAGVQWEWDFRGYLIRETWLDANQAPIVLGYATRIIIRDISHKAVKESYFDGNGKPMLRTDGGYAYRTYIYDKDDRVIGERYYGLDDQAIISSFGYAGYNKELDEENQTTTITYLGTDGKPVEIPAGYAMVKKEYNSEGLVIRESYYKSNGDPASIGNSGYSSLKNEYLADGALSLTYYYSIDDTPLDCGSGYFHQFLQGLKGKTFIISARDEASGAMTVTLVEDMHELGIQTDLRGKYRSSFYAVISAEGAIEKIGNEVLTYNTKIDNMYVNVISSGYNSKSNSSIKLDEIEYSKNVRGLNIVVIEGGLIESISFDTSSQEMFVTR